MGLHQSALRRSGREIRSHQGVRAGAAGAADAGISEGPSGEHGGPGQGRAGQFPRPCALRPGRHAGDDVGEPAGIHRPRPSDLDPTYQGYAIGRWIDTTGNGSYDTLEAETRGPFKGPRAYDATGLPLAFDNQSIFTERFHLDKRDPNLLHDEITTIDHALTRPWSVDKTWKRDPNPYPNWSRVSCTETTQHVVVGKEAYMLSADGLLMPAKKDQAPPDLRYFKQTPR